MPLWHVLVSIAFIVFIRHLFRTSIIRCLAFVCAVILLYLTSDDADSNSDYFINPHLTCKRRDVSYRAQVRAKFYFVLYNFVR